MRLQAMNWLFAAIRFWLLQDRAQASDFPNGNDSNWNIVGQMAYFHNLEPVLYWIVSNNNSMGDIPDWLKQTWEKAYFENFLINEEYFGALKAFLDESAMRGIPVIVLKGPALIGRIYKDPGLRTMSDLDIFCSPGDLPQLVNIALDMGYRAFDPGDEAIFSHHVALLRPASRGPDNMKDNDFEVILELHFMPYEAIRDHQGFMQSAWKGKKWIKINGFECHVLSLEMELVFNVAHLVQHQFDVSLKHYLDIMGLLIFCKQGLNWDQLDSLLKNTGLEQEFMQTVLFLSRVIGLPFSSSPSWLKKSKCDQQGLDSSFHLLMALLDQKRLMDVKGFIWNFRLGLSNRKSFKDKTAFVGKTLLAFLGRPAYHYRSCSMGDLFCGSLRRLLFYTKRIISTLKHLPEIIFFKKRSSLPAERADAKKRLMILLLRKIDTTR